MEKVKQPYYSLYYPKCSKEYLSLLKEGKTYGFNEDYYNSIKEELIDLDEYLPEILTRIMDDEFVKSKHYHKYPAAYFELRLEDKEIEEAGGYMVYLFLRLWIEEHPEYKQLLYIKNKMTEKEWQQKFEELKQFTLKLGLPII